MDTATTTIHIQVSEFCIIDALVTVPKKQLSLNPHVMIDHRPTHNYFWHLSDMNMIFVLHQYVYFR